MFPIRALAYTGSQSASVASPVNTHGAISIRSTSDQYRLSFMYNKDGLNNTFNFSSYTVYMFIDSLTTWPDHLYVHLYGIGPTDDDAHIAPLRHFMCLDDFLNDTSYSYVYLTRASPFLIDFPSTSNN